MFADRRQVFQFFVKVEHSLEQGRLLVGDDHRMPQQLQEVQLGQTELAEQLKYGPKITKLTGLGLLGEHPQ